MDVVSFFAGCGGLDLGFEQAGFRVVMANELDSVVSETYIHNHPHTKLVIDDICNINPEDIPDCDGFIGGPPCQSWSVAGRQLGLSDKRGKLFLVYIELIKKKNPKFFLIENVKGLLDEKFKSVFEDFIFTLENANYDVQWKLLDAVNYMVPQNRERVFIIGFRKDLNVSFEFPQPSTTKVSLSQAIGDISEEPKPYGKDEFVSLNDSRSNHDYFNGEFGLYYRRGNRRRSWDKPSFTIHATGENAPLHPSSPHMLYIGHENWIFKPGKEHEYRRLSVRECARIQTFPDSFVFKSHDIKALYKMIGNAVPPLLANILAKKIRLTFDNIENESELKTIGKKKLSNISVLVGYFKNDNHHDVVVKNLLYNVRSDGRKGSLFPKGCPLMPEYLLLHHKEKAEIYELEAESPRIEKSSFLRSLGFDLSGDAYLCFKLRNAVPLSINQRWGNVSHLIYDRHNYSPYITTLDKVLDKKYEHL